MISLCDAYSAEIIALAIIVTMVTGIAIAVGLAEVIDYFQEKGKKK